MYSIELRESDKVFFVKASGSVNEEEGKSLISDLLKQLEEIDCSNLFLVLDAEGVIASNQSATYLMEKVMQIYIDSPFKNKFIISSKNVVTNLQVKRVGKSTNFETAIKPVKSYEEVLDLIR